MLFQHRLQQLVTLVKEMLSILATSLDMQLRLNGADSTLSATYAFELTDGAGNIYASFTGSDILNVQRLNNSDAAIVSAVEAQIMATAFADTTITDDEFEVAYSGGVLTISNKLGRDLAIENFSSTMAQLWYQSLMA